MRPGEGLSGDLQSVGPTQGCQFICLGLKAALTMSVLSNIQET